MMRNRGKASDVRARLLDALALFTEEELDGGGVEQNNSGEPPPSMNGSNPLQASNLKHDAPMVNKPCMHYLWHGHCNIPNCRYLHTNNFEPPSPPNEPDLNRRQSSYRKQECLYFSRNGHCAFGDKCKYAHIRNHQTPRPPNSNHSSHHGEPPNRNPHYSQRNRGPNRQRPPLQSTSYPRDNFSETGSSYRNSPVDERRPPRLSPNGSMDAGVASQRAFGTRPYAQNQDSTQRTSPMHLSRHFEDSDLGLRKKGPSPYPFTAEHPSPYSSRFRRSPIRSYTGSPPPPTPPPGSHTPLKDVSIQEVQAILEATSEKVLALVTAANVSDIASLCVYERRPGSDARALFQGPLNAERYRQHVMAGLCALEDEAKGHLPEVFFNDARHLAIFQMLIRGTFSTLAGHHPQGHSKPHAEHSFQRCFLPMVFLAVHPALNSGPGMLASTADMLHAFCLVSLSALVDQFCRCTQKCLESGVLEERQCSPRTLLLHDPGCFIPLSFLQLFAPFIHLLDLLASKYLDLVHRLLEPAALNTLETLVLTWQQKVHNQELPTMESKAAVAAVKSQFAALKSKLAVRAPYPELINREGLM